MKKSIHVVTGLSTMMLGIIPLMSYYKETFETPGPQEEIAIKLLAGFIGAYIGSITPDLDYPAKLAKKKNLTPDEKNSLYNHRGLLHTLFFPVVTLIILISIRIKSIYWIENPIVGVWGLIDGFIIGYLLHLFADMFTQKGVKIGYPIIRKNISFSKIKIIGFLCNFHGLWLALYIFILIIFIAIFKQIV